MGNQVLEIGEGEVKESAGKSAKNVATYLTFSALTANVIVMLIGKQIEFTPEEMALLLSFFTVLINIVSVYIKKRLG